MLVGPGGVKLAFFSIELTVEQMNLLGARTKRTIIFESELLALVLAFSIWSGVIRSSSVICFIDNNATRDVAISGSGRNAVGSSLIEFLLKLDMTTNVTPWYSRVPSPSNISDEPSRGEVECLNQQQVRQVSALDELSDILVVLRELVG